jgi:hypothetical protein
MPSATFVLNAVGSTPIVPVTNDLLRGTFMLPNILCTLSNGANLTYSVQQTGDNITAPGYNPATGNWQPITGLSALTATANGTLGACVTALRAVVSAYVSGSLTFQFVWAGTIG